MWTVWFIQGVGASREGLGTEWWGFWTLVHVSLKAWIWPLGREKDGLAWWSPAEAGEKAWDRGGRTRRRRLQEPRLGP